MLYETRRNNLREDICWSNFTIIFLSILAILLSVENIDASCQKGRTVGLTLSDWLCVWGIVSLSLSFFYSCHQFVRGIFVYRMTGIAYGIFITIWDVIGIFILTNKQNHACLSYGTDFGLLSLICIVIGYGLHLHLCVAIYKM